MFFVRTATERDIAAVRALLTETWHATYDALYGREKVEKITADWHSEAALLRRLERRDGEFVVADDGARLAGMGFAAMAPKLERTAFLHQLYVLPQFQRQGVGSDLFAELENCFPAATAMRLEVAEGNVGAIAFYRRLGFTQTERRADDPDMPVVVMEKPLFPHS